jgi:hypothetical protein
VPAYATLSYLLQGGGWRERGAAVFYKIPQWSLPIEKKLTLLDGELLPDPIRDKGESDTRWNGRCQIRERYLKQRKEIASWNISTFGYWTQGEKRIRDRFKLLQFYHKYDPAEQGILIGCVIEKKTRTYYRGRHILTYIAWAGFPDDEITQKMEASETYLDVTANTEALQKAKILLAENVRLQDNVDDLIEALQFAKSGDEAVAAEISGKEPEERAGQPSYSTVLLKYYAKLAFGLIIVLVIAIILLMHFGVI